MQEDNGLNTSDREKEGGEEGKEPKKAVSASAVVDEYKVTLSELERANPGITKVCKAPKNAVISCYGKKKLAGVHFSVSLEKIEGVWYVIGNLLASCSQAKVKLLYKIQNPQRFLIIPPPDPETIPYDVIQKSVVTFYPEKTFFSNVISPNTPERINRVKMLLNEQKVCKKMGMNSALVRVLYAGGKRKIKLLLEYKKGKDLHEYLKDDVSGINAANISGRAVYMNKYLRIAYLMALALKSIHRQGIIHGDIKLENIVVQSGSGLKVYFIDFGLSREKVFVAQGFGTQGYAAPELHKIENTMGRRDVFSFGVACFEAFFDIKLRTKTPSEILNIVKEHVVKLQEEKRDVGNFIISMLQEAIDCGLQTKINMFGFSKMCIDGLLGIEINARKPRDAFDLLSKYIMKLQGREIGIGELILDILYKTDRCEITEKIDIFSFGIVLAEMFFNIAREGAQLKVHELLRRVCGIEKEIGELIVKLLFVDPSRRPTLDKTIEKLRDLVAKSFSVKPSLNVPLVPSRLMPNLPAADLNSLALSPPLAKRHNRHSHHKHRSSGQQHAYDHIKRDEGDELQQQSSDASSVTLLPHFQLFRDSPLNGIPKAQTQQAELTSSSSSSRQGNSHLHLQPPSPQ